MKGKLKDPTDKRRQIYDERPNLGMDNHFSGDATSKEVGENGWKCNVTCLWWGVMSVGRLVIINLIKLSSMDVIHDKMVV